jgi:undecaprenyl-diphosphatase
MYDERLLHAVVGRRRPLLDRIARSLTKLADPPFAISLALAASLGFFPGYEHAGAVAAFSLAFSHLLVQVLKRVLQRPRPSLPVGISSLIKIPQCFSFPSGHATAAFSLALPLALAAPWPVGIPIFLLGTSVGLTRCYLGVHYPGDVLAGWALASFAFLWAEPVLGLFA